MEQLWQPQSATMKELCYGLQFHTVQRIAHLRCVKQADLFERLENTCARYEAVDQPDMLASTANLTKEIKEIVLRFVEALKMFNIVEPMDYATLRKFIPEGRHITQELYELLLAYQEGKAVEPCENVSSQVFWRQGKTVRDVNVLIGRVLERHEIYQGAYDRLRHIPASVISKPKGSFYINTVSYARPCIPLNVS